MISAVEANEWSRKNSSTYNSSTYNSDCKKVTDSIEKATAEGKFKAEVTVSYDNRNTLMRELENKGFTVEVVTQGIYSTNKIDIQW